MRRICVFCGSKPGNRVEFAQAADELAEAMVRRELELVYGGSRLGLMGLIANSMLRRGGRVIGVMPRLLMKKEAVHPELTELHVVSSMHERKAKMAALSDAFISMPGGLGTWEETLEILTWRQLGIHDKPCGLLNVAGYFDPILDLFQHGRQQGFLRGKPDGLLLTGDHPEPLLDQMLSCIPELEDPWPIFEQA